MWSRIITRVASKPAVFLQCAEHAAGPRSLYTWGRTDKTVADRFRHYPGASDNVFLTYIWIDGTGKHVRAKTKVAEREPKDVSEISTWAFDGSSTYQASGGNSDLTLKPVAMCRDPFFVGKSKLVMCEVYNPEGKPVATNHRHACMESVKKTKNEEPWFGFEQEYTLVGINNKPLGFPEEGFPAPQGPYYCSAGAGRSAGRDVCDAHLLACRYAGLMIGGTNAEVLLGQWEYQIGPCVGVDGGDQLWLSRYIMDRVAEEFGVQVTFHPKPVTGDWNGTGNHCNFSTKTMRNDGGVKEIWKAIKKLEPKHMDHIRVYDPTGGEDNKMRLTGKHETAPIDKFSAAAASRNVSIRIPKPVEVAGKGWFEDRRPSANCDPYQVIDRLLKTVCLDQ